MISCDELLEQAKKFGTQMYCVKDEKVHLRQNAHAIQFYREDKSVGSLLFSTGSETDFLHALVALQVLALPLKPDGLSIFVQGSLDKIDKKRNARCVLFCFHYNFTSQDSKPYTYTVIPIVVNAWSEAKLDEDSPSHVRLDSDKNAESKKSVQKILSLVTQFYGEKLPDILSDNTAEFESDKVQVDFKSMFEDEHCMYIDPFVYP